MSVQSQLDEMRKHFDSYRELGNYIGIADVTVRKIHTGKSEAQGKTIKLITKAYEKFTKEHPANNKAKATNSKDTPSVLNRVDLHLRSAAKILRAESQTVEPIFRLAYNGLADRLEEISKSIT